MQRNLLKVNFHSREANRLLTLLKETVKFSGVKLHSPFALMGHSNNIIFKINMIRDDVR